MIQEHLTIARKETDYSDIGGVGLTVNGKLVIVDNFYKLKTETNTRIIENPPVENALSAPIKVYFDPTFVCGLSCSWCLAGVPTTRNKKEVPAFLNAGEVRNINNQIIRAGVLQVKIGGGEPFIYNPFWDSVEQLGEAGIGLSTSTSGVTLTDERFLTNKKIGLLSRYGVKISLSTDGKPEYHNRERGKPGLLESVLDGGIKRLRDGGIEAEKIEYRATITNNPESIKQLDFLSRLSMETQTLIRIRLAKPYGSASDNNLGVVSLTPEIIKLMRSLREYSNDNPFINIDSFLRYDKNPAVKTGLDCGAGTREGHIDPKGRFFPCGPLFPYMKKSHDLLNKKGITLLEYWQVGDAFIDVRGFYKKENEESPCMDCVFIDSCQGGCASVRLFQGLDMNPLCPKNI